MSWNGYIPSSAFPKIVGEAPDRPAEGLNPAPGVTTPGDPKRGAYEAPEPRGDLLWAAMDLDGTIAEPVWTPDNPTSEIGPPRWDRVALLMELVEHGYKIVIHTSRPWTDYEAIEGWLRHHGIPFRSIVCGKLLAKIYIDDRARWSEATSWLPEYREDPA